MIGVMKLGKGIVMQGTIDSHVVNSNFFQWLQIIVNDHPPRPNDGHFPDLARLQPTTLDRRQFRSTPHTPPKMPRAVFPPVYACRRASWLWQDCNDRRPGWRWRGHEPQDR